MSHLSLTLGKTPQLQNLAAQSFRHCTLPRMSRVWGHWATSLPLGYPVPSSPSIPCLSRKKLHLLLSSVPDPISLHPLTRGGNPLLPPSRPSRDRKGDKRHRRRRALTLAGQPSVRLAPGLSRLQARGWRLCRGRVALRPGQGGGPAPSLFPPAAAA